MINNSHAAPGQHNAAKESNKDKVRINNDIRAHDVRLIGPNSEQMGIVPLKRALMEAENLGLDLVEIASSAQPPVCRIMNYGKFLFEQNKQKQQARKKQKQIEIKEIKFRPVTEEADYQVKIRNLTRFLNEGDKAKVTLKFRGRELSHQELGVAMMKRVEKDLAEISVVEQATKVEGKQMIMMLAPKKKK